MSTTDLDKKHSGDIPVLPARPAGHSEPPAPAALCRRTGLARSTAHRLVTELVEWGGLERTDVLRYRIGLRLFEVGMRVPGRWRAHRGRAALP
ncbi:helix-turn-helix domain-containing protein [Actinomadura yumaensis]|uniref:helix-turn-helix domain-containing protein n=1 Tax=Actinomadura yumaensis TaxID=111807 RepID=UPI0036234F37